VRSKFDIDVSWQWVAVDVVCASCASIPGLGIFFIGYLFIKYCCQSWRIIAPSKVKLGVLICIYLLQAIASLLRVVIYYADYSKLRDAPQQDKEHVLHKLLDREMVRGTTTVVTISAIFVYHILLVNCAKVYEDVAVHKRRSSKKMSNGEPKPFTVLKRLQNLFSDYYQDVEPGKPRQEQLKGVDHFLSWFSALTVGLGLAWQSLTYWRSIRFHSIYVVLAAGAYIHTIYNWYHLVKFSIMCVQKMRRNTRQVLIFRSLVVNQDFDKWRPLWQDTLCELFQKVDEDGSLLKEVTCEVRQGHSRREKAIEALNKAVVGESNPEPETWIEQLEVPLLTSVVDALVQGRDIDQDMRFDFHKPEDVRDWWTLRQHLLTDLQDESVVMDYYSVAVMLLIACFFVWGFFDFTLHHDTWTTLKMAWEAVAQEEFRVHGFLSAAVQIAPLIGILTMVCCIITLSVIFLQIINACISINELLQSDTKLLLAAAAELSIAIHAPGEHQSKGGLESMTDPAFLSVLARNAEENDQRQTLLGWPITQNLRAAIMTSVAAAILNEAWMIAQPVMTNFDFSIINALFQGSSMNSTYVGQM